MSAIFESVIALVDALREQGIEPNRVRMSPKSHAALGKELIERMMEVMGLRLEVADDCPPDNIYVDHSDDPDIVASQTTRRFAVSSAEEFLEEQRKIARDRHGA